MSLDFSKVIYRITNLREKLESFEKVCGAGLIHDTNQHLCIMINWERNFEYYIKCPEEFKFRLHTGDSFKPTQEEFDEHFNNVLCKTEKFLADNVKL